jgi:hypothetical protein
MARQIKASDLFDNDDIFKGVRESAEKTIEVLEKVKGEFKQMADESKKAISNADLSNVKGITEFISATEKANKLKKDTITIEQQELTAKKNLIAIQKEEEKLKRERLKTSQQEQKIANDQIKASEKATKQAQNEASAYKQLEANTRALKNQSKELAAQMLQMESAGLQSSSAYQKLSDEYEKVTMAAREGDKALKGIDKTVGDNFRNVGNYESGTQNLKKELRELTKTLQTMETTDPRFAEMSMRAGELKDQISDTNAVIKATAGTGIENMAGAMATAGQVGVAAFQGVESAMALMGVESESVMQTMMRLQALAGLGDALKSLGAIGDSLTEIRAGFGAAFTKMGQFLKGQNSIVSKFSEMTTAGKVFTATGIGLLIAAVGVLIAKWDDVSAAMSGVSEGQQLYNDAVKESISAISGELSAADKLTKSLEDESLSREQKLKLVKEFQAEYPGLLDNINMEKMSIAGINAQLIDNITLLKLQAKQKAIQSVRAQEYEKTVLNTLEAEKEQGSWWSEGGLDLSTLTWYSSNKEYYNDLNKEAEKNIKFLDQQDAEIQKQIDSMKKKGARTGELTALEKQQQDQQNKHTNNAIIKQYEFNETLNKTNEYLTQQIELQQQLTEVLQQKDLDAITREIDAQIMSIQNLIRTGQEFDTNKLRELLDKKAQMEADNIEQRRQYELSAMKQTYIDKAQLEIDNVQNDYESNKQNIINKASDEIKSAAGNKTEIARINKEKNEALADLDNQYIAQTEIVNANILKMTEDLKTELEIINAKANEELVKNDEAAQTEYLEKLDEVDTAYNDYLDRKIESADKTAEKEIEIETKRAETLQSIANQLTQYFIDQSNKKIEQMDKEIEAAQSQYDTLKTLAENGNINAKESLAEQQRIINEANRKKEKELRRQQAIQMASAVYSTYNAKVLEGVENPLIETIKDTVLLQQFANTLLSQMPAFFDGTEDTGTHGQGVDGKGGFHAILHPHERVIPKSLNEQIGAMSNEQLTMLAQQYNNGRLIGANGQVGTAFETAVLVNKIDELKNTIKNKPETNIELGEITQSMMHIVKTTKQGNTIKTNRFKIRK